MAKVITFTRLRAEAVAFVEATSATNALALAEQAMAGTGSRRFRVVAMVAVEFGFRAVGCDVKANISASGERIYHVPGQEYYYATSINWLRGERWFCSENAARAAGWRRARV